jgi:hypothetical protein
MAVFVGLSQLVTGHITIGQSAMGTYVLAQGRLGEVVLSMKRADPEAIEFFKTLPIIKYFLP